MDTQVGDTHFNVTLVVWRMVFKYVQSCDKSHRLGKPWAYTHEQYLVDNSISKSWVLWAFARCTMDVTCTMQPKRIAQTKSSKKRTARQGVYRSNEVAEPAACNLLMVDFVGCSWWFPIVGTKSKHNANTDANLTMRVVAKGQIRKAKYEAEKGPNRNCTKSRIACTLNPSAATYFNS